MDTNHTLERMLELAVENTDDELAASLIELDAWLSGGASLPTRWTKVAWTNEVTIAQSITLGSKLRRGDITRISFGGAGLPSSYLYVTYLNDSFVLGIDREGRASS